MSVYLFIAVCVLLKLRMSFANFQQSTTEISVIYYQVSKVELPMKTDRAFGNCHLKKLILYILEQFYSLQN